MITIAVLLLIALLSIPCPVTAAQDALGNLKPEETITAPAYAPGSWIVLPDGRRTVIREYLPNGQLRTDLGIVISPEGVIVEGEGEGQKVTILEQTPEQANIATPGGLAPVLPQTVIPEGQPEAKTAEPLPKIAVPEQQPPAVAVPPKAPENAQTPAPTPGKAEGPISIVELLPMTKVPPGAESPEKKAEAAPKQPEKKPQPKPEQAEKKAKPEQKQPEKRQPEQKKAEKKPAVGQEMRIPPEAAKTGNLDFLEGCWQGTRPEYISKRTIRECFCFGANGKNGKRRVFDPIGHRMCIGSAKANLSRAGVLSVTSSGAACNDGVRWGAAQMSCRNSGPKTPCSWMFPDAQGGHQAYTIPFVRVESCGR